MTAEWWAEAEVTVPATSANLGPGFDCLGLALEPRNRLLARAADFTASRSWPDDTDIRVGVSGEGEGVFPEDRHNLVVRAMEQVFERAGTYPRKLEVSCQNGIPSCGGLGSSAAAIVGGCLAARALVGAGKEPGWLSEHDVLQIAARMEGHPDNVAAALLGGLTAAALGEKGSEGDERGGGGKVIVTRLPVSSDWLESFRVVLALPGVRLATKAARAALPRTVAWEDAVFNVQRLALLVGALAAGDEAMLGMGMADRLHQPYRLPLVPGLEQALDAARGTGACAAAISGAGPAVISFVRGENRAAGVGEAMLKAFRAAGVRADWLMTRIENSGAAWQARRP